jgi:hypothetical protein
VACYSPALPNLKGLELIFADRSNWPTENAKYYITCDDDANLDHGGVVKELTEEEFNKAKESERDAYAFIIRKERDRMMAQAQNRLDKALRLEAMGQPHEPIYAIQYYMQALADVPQQENFPWEYTYPNYDDFVDTVPSSITMRQTRLALISAGLLDSVEAAIKSIEDPTQRLIAQTEWNTASIVQRNSQWVIQLAGELGLTEEELDNLFKQAVNL